LTCRRTVPTQSSPFSPSQEREEEEEEGEEGEEKEKQEIKSTQFLDFGFVSGHRKGEGEREREGRGGKIVQRHPSMCQNPDGSVCVVMPPDLSSSLGKKNLLLQDDLPQEEEREDERNAWETIMSTFMVVLPPGTDAFDQREGSVRRIVMAFLLFFDLLLGLNVILTWAMAWTAQHFTLLLIIPFVLVDVCGFLAVKHEDIRMLSIFTGIKLCDVLYFTMHLDSYVIILRMIIGIGLVWTSLGYRSVLQYHWYQTLRYPQLFDDFG